MYILSKLSVLCYSPRPFLVQGSFPWILMTHLIHPSTSIPFWHGCVLLHDPNYIGCSHAQNLCSSRVLERRTYLEKQKRTVIYQREKSSQIVSSILNKSAWKGRLIHGFFFTNVCRLKKRLAKSGPLPVFVHPKSYKWMGGKQEINRPEPHPSFQNEGYSQGAVWWWLSTLGSSQQS